MEVDTCLPVNVLIQPNKTAAGPLQGYTLSLEAEPQVLQVLCWRAAQRGGE